VFIRPRDHGLTLHTMYFANEIRKVAGYGQIDKSIKLKPQEIKLAEQLVETLSAEFKPEQYHDTFQDKLQELIAAKQKGKTVVEEKAPKRAPVIDMMEALKRSLQNTAQKGKKTARARAGSEHEHGRKLAS
jgi:DNA end-binding protein Ku